jgi:hypothetical protein
MLQMEAVQKWDGVLPQIIGGSAVPFIQIPMKGEITEAPVKPKPSEAIRNGARTFYYDIHCPVQPKEKS